MFAPRQCEFCGQTLPLTKETGRPARFCGDTCRVSFYRKGPVRPFVAGRQKSGKGTDLPDFQKTRVSLQNSSSKSTTCKDGIGISKIRWIQVNECTWKLRAGEQVRVPAIHGFWAGFNTDLAVAWVIDIGWISDKGVPCWFARTRDQTFGPTTLGRAKAAALELVQGRPPEPGAPGRLFAERLIGGPPNTDRYQTLLLEYSGSAS